MGTRPLEMNTFHYHEEDGFREESNSRRLKQLFEARDYRGLLEFALLLNHQASFANSKMKWALSEALNAARPGNFNYEIPEDLKAEIDAMGWEA